MKIVDVYIFRKFFLIFFLTCVTLVGLYVVFDVFTKFDEFWKAEASLFRLITAVAEYYFINSFAVIDMMFPFFTLLAA